MADRLAIYRGALRLLGPSNLASLTEDRPEKLALDGAWTDAVNFMLEQGMWHFAIRTAQLQPDTDVEPLFGFDYAYAKPEDWVRTVSICYEPTFREGIRQYEDETSYWHTSWSTLYVRYISNDDAYGWNIGAWRVHFAKALEAYLAFECGLPISSDKGNRNDLYTLFKSRLQDAKTKDAVDERVREKPPGRWTRSRQQGYPGSRRGE
ncbi:hypothetical protein HGP16_25525 [Rhizobium sp. P40RR-XXII]|uniref:hypothetical protein n=1 Tax=Rhizobium sp. P40RR-XXII TaxID=2726739 RepID=UPI001456AB8F|nr:hypothetical protein [Rhizobium sp. P40RR-XXII]NLS19903.1 hypothetical protein [Rhizobium sp. P40RR-XXII]